MRIAILRTQVPFITGGAESLADDLRNQLAARTFQGTPIQAEVITVPFLWYPPLELVNQIMLWRLLNLRECDGKPIDLVVPMKFPAYFVQHPNIRPWLAHQHRQAYDLHDTPFGDLHQTAEGREVGKYVRELDTEVLAPLRISVISKTVGDRLQKYNGLTSEVLYPPPPNQELYQRQGDYGDFILVPGRLDAIKRQDLFLKGLARVPGLKSVIIGDGPRRTEWEDLTRELGLADRVRFLGWVNPADKVRLYSTCLAVFNAPFNEDYGYITLEAFLSGKPVITMVDSGGVLEFVADQETGWVTEPTTEALTATLDAVWAGGPQMARRLGDGGYSLVKELDISWDHVIRGLLS